MIVFARSTLATIVDCLTHVASDGGRWLPEEKRNRIYPLTAELLACDVSKRRQVAKLLACCDGHCGYAAVSALLECSSERPTIFLPVDTFDPADPWSKVFRQALAKLKVGGKTLCEVGPGSGVATIELINLSTPPAKIVLDELDPHVLAVTRLNVETVCQERLTEFGIELEYLVGDAANVFQWLALQRSHRFDYIIGCIPQVPAGGDNLWEWQNMAHEYDDRIHSHFRDWGLGLLYDVQRAGKEVLAADGAMVFVHSGRVPDAVHRQFHQSLGLKVRRTLINEMIAHCPTTSLEYLFGHKEHLLFADREGNKPLTPEDAECKRQQAIATDPNCHDCGVYHRVLVLETVPN
ncbi:MAG: hypothetical protein A2729_01515 [Candidatus Buchananbacteria bacterium RIFCSPHIGHO2_01_FULL_39_14]|uniref:Methyltransferase small domain-containing protein n=2 Tax=Candidatus Buchananiibacteriota TaxID=1817903 RepID=A0A1G1YSC2_9BACT|nr:MAG: hypothetical protein A2729_01515 [Candidatus Buchananbacteria bacterium RIFCSPHIGHO2_01_FULL_39_14]OGY55243.1 MAG: hypothetical protein A2912_04010 [Candidatus Buchananbacteria bacterium RIFCSPLOWO2_01_FULL_40_23b]